MQECTEGQSIVPAAAEVCDVNILRGKEDKQVKSMILCRDVKENKEAPQTKPSPGQDEPWMDQNIAFQGYVPRSTWYPCLDLLSSALSLPLPANLRMLLLSL